MKEKENFIMYHNQYSLIEELSDKDKGILLDSLYKYSMNNDIPNFEKGSPLSIVFKSFKNSIDISNDKYQETCRKNQENINKRYEKEKYFDKHIFLDNEKVSYPTFQKTYKKGYSDKYGNTLSFSQIYEEQFQCISEGNDIILLREKYNCNRIDTEDIKRYFEEYLE